MKNKFLLATVALCAQTLFAQTPPPGLPEDNGLRPKGNTIFLHNETTIFNDHLEGSLGVAIASNGNVIVGWEDDDGVGDTVVDLEAVWQLLNSNGDILTPEAEINSTFATGGPINSAFRGYFRPDGSPILGWTSWGPKIKANLYGDGIGMGATSFSLAAEIPAFVDLQIESDESAGDVPTVQLLNNDGSPIGIVAGASEAHADTPGDIRIADWEYLSNGNILIIGESRQEADIVDKFGGSTPVRHAIYRIVTPAGVEVRTNSLLSETPDRIEMWLGAASVQNGFAARFSLNGAATMRLFANDGTPTSTNINLAAHTGVAINNGGGRGEDIGFHGNGRDAYVYAVSGTDDAGLKQVWVTVFNANGSVRWSKAATDESTPLTLTDRRVDAAIDERGRVLVVFADNYPTAGGASITLGRLFDATGAPMGGVFHVSEVDIPDATTQEARRPRAFWRNNLAAIAWESRNNPSFPGQLTMAVRTFSTFEPGTVEAAGMTRIVSDTALIPTTAAANGNWEPYASVLGNSHFLIEGNTHASDGTSQRYVVRVQPVAGGAGTTVEGFYADNGTPYTGQINLSRQNGNPGRVAGDKRPGAVNYIVGGEVSAHGFVEFQSTTPSRWETNGMFNADNRYASVQSYALSPTMTPTPLTKLIDPLHASISAEFSGSIPEVSRFGGDLAALDNGNFVIVIDDRSNLIAPVRTPTVAIITPTGEIVKAGFAVDPATSDQIWANVAAHKSGFAVRFRGEIYFYDNAGTFRGKVDQNTSGETTFDRTRGDGTRIASHINSHFVYLGGGNTPVATRNSAVKVAAFDSRDFTFAAITLVSEPSFPAGTGGYDRVNVAVDALDRLVVAYESVPTGFTLPQTVTRVLAYNGTTKTFTPLTTSFYPFVNSVPGTAAAPNTTRTFRPSLAMTTKQIAVAAKGEINLENKPDLGPDSQTELNFYTVFSHPAPAEDPTTPIGGGLELDIARNANNSTLTWTADGVFLESSPTLPGTWTRVTTTGKTHTVPSTTGNLFFRLVRP